MQSCAIQEIQSFCQRLSDLLSKTISCPLTVAYSTFPVWAYLGGAVYFFFIAGSAVTRCLVAPIAGLAAQQERLEADFRMTHVRCEACECPQIPSCQGSGFRV